MVTMLIIKDMTAATKIHMNTITAITCEVLGCDKRKIFLRDRFAPLPYARQIICYIAVQCEVGSQNEIAEFMKYEGHGMVSINNTKINNLISQYSKDRELVDGILSKYLTYVAANRTCEPCKYEIIKIKFNK